MIDKPAPEGAVSAIVHKVRPCNFRKASAVRSDSARRLSGTPIALSMAARTMYRRPSTSLGATLSHVEKVVGLDEKPPSGRRMTMSEERFDRIEQRLDALQVGLGSLSQEMRVL